MEAYPGVDLTTEELLYALTLRVKQQRSVWDRSVRDQDFRSMVCAIRIFLSQC